MAYFPFFIDIKEVKGLIIGGGKHALGKIEKLLPYKPKLHVIATEISEEVREITKENEIPVDVRRFQESDLEPRPDFVIIACDDMKERKRITNLCRERHILVNGRDKVVINLGRNLGSRKRSFKRASVLARGREELKLSHLRVKKCGSLFLKEPNV